MNSTLITTYDPETGELETITQLTSTTAIAIAPKWCYYTSLWFGGWNIYSIERDRAVLIETYGTEQEAIWVRDSIISNLEAHAEMIIV